MCVYCHWQIKKNQNWNLKENKEELNKRNSNKVNMKNGSKALLFKCRAVIAHFSLSCKWNANLNKEKFQTFLCMCVCAFKKKMHFRLSSNDIYNCNFLHACSLCTCTGFFYFFFFVFHVHFFSLKCKIV